MEDSLRPSNSAFVSVRQVKISDSRVLLNWRNDPAVLKWSETSRAIEEVEHETWFNNWISEYSAKGYFHIIELENIGVGMVRLDLREANTYEISVLVDPNFQGRGIAEIGINLVFQKILDSADYLIISAMIHRENRSSISLFQKLEFENVSVDGKFLRLIRRLHR